MTTGQMTTDQEEVGLTTETECEFCVKIADPVRRSSQYDFHVIWSDDYFHVVVALGALAGGHVLVVNNTHKLAMSQLSENEWNALDLVLHSWTDRLEKLWQRESLVFEHGPSTGSSGGACVYHAHLQVLPRPNVRRTDLLVDGMVRISEIKDLGILYPSGGYLMMKMREGIWVMPDGRVVSQFFRRRICALQGRPGDWDYLVYTNRAAMDETILMLKADEHVGM